MSFELSCRHSCRVRTSVTPPSHWRHVWLALASQMPLPRWHSSHHNTLPHTTASSSSSTQTTPTHSSSTPHNSKQCETDGQRLALSLHTLPALPKGVRGFSRHPVAHSGSCLQPLVVCTARTAAKRWCLQGSSSKSRRRRTHNGSSSYRRCNARRKPYRVKRTARSQGGPRLPLLDDSKGEESEEGGGQRERPWSGLSCQTAAC